MDIEVGFGCVTSDGIRVYIIGGTDKNGDIMDIVQVYNTENQEWSQLNESMNIGRASASCSYYKNKLYVFGGIMSNGNDTNTI